MVRLIRNLLLLLLLAVATGVRAADSLDFSAMQPHPRLLWKAGGEQEVRKAIKRSNELKKVYDYLCVQADSILGIEPCVYRKEGYRLLAVSREVFRRISVLSFVYRMNGGDKYVERVEEEMMSVCSFSDWNPSHFLDTGEMTMALAIGYDWLYDVLDEDVKKAVREAITEKGFKPSYNNGYNWFLRSDINWNQVCNAGLMYGALAMYEDSPEECRHIITRAVETVVPAMKVYGPDGNYPEGCNYWGYGTTFNMFLIAALESALGTDAGLSDMEGFMESARYMSFMTGTTGIPFNYSDSRAVVQTFPAMYWFAFKEQDASLLTAEYDFLKYHGCVFTPEEVRFVPLILIYGSRIPYYNINIPYNNRKKTEGKIWIGHGKTPVVMVRTDRRYGKGVYLGIKGGKASVSHSHMDAGSFVFEAKGVRWAMDFGMQEYYTLEKEGVSLWDMSQKSQRWDVFRYDNFAHNTISVNGKKHNVDGFVSIVDEYTRKDKLGARLDLTPLFFGNVESALRDIYVLKERSLVVADTLLCGGEPATVRWTMVTPAEVRILDDNNCELRCDGKKMLMDVSASHDFSLTVADNVPPHKYDAPNDGTCRVVIEMKLNPGEKGNINVVMRP